MVKHENKICKLGLTFCKLELRPLFLEKERNKVISAENSAIQIRISYFFLVQRNVKMHILHTVIYTFIKVLIRRIC